MSSSEKEELPLDSAGSPQLSVLWLSLSVVSWSVLSTLDGTPPVSWLLPRLSDCSAEQLSSSGSEPVMALLARSSEASDSEARSQPGTVPLN